MRSGTAEVCNGSDIHCIPIDMNLNMGSFYSAFVHLQDKESKSYLWRTVFKYPQCGQSK